MRILVVSVMCFWSVSVLASPQSVDDLKRTPDALYFSGGTFLRMFPYVPAPYDDYVVEVVYYELPAENLLAIAFGGEAEDFFVMHKRPLAGDERLKFFELIEAQTNKNIGVGSCSYAKESGQRIACKYTFNVKDVSFSGSSESIVRATLQFVADRHGDFVVVDSYILGRDSYSFRVQAGLEREK